jgi:putative ABC transport system substrate-binding protein
MLVFRAVRLAPLFVVLLFCACLAHGHESISLVTSNNHYAMVHRIEAALFQNPHFQTPVHHYLVEKTTPQAYQEIVSKSRLVVTVGSEALNEVLANQVNTPVLSILIRQSIFEQLLQRHGRSLHNAKFPIAVIYLDQPLSRQFNLIGTLFKDHEPPRLGVLLSTYSLREKENLQTISTKHNMVLTSLFVKPFENPVSVLDSILNEVDVVLALPDPKIYHSSTARGILLTAFHKRIPIIAYSHTFVNNGALASVYSNTKQIGDQTANTIVKIMRYSFNSIPKEQYPTDYSIAINYQVAQSIGLNLAIQNTIKKTMDEFEKSDNKGTL